MRQLKSRANKALKAGKATAAQALQARAAALRPTKQPEDGDGAGVVGGRRSPTPPARRRAKLTSRATVQHFNVDDPVQDVDSEDKGRGKKGKGKSKSKNKGKGKQKGKQTGKNKWDDQTKWKNSYQGGWKKAQWHRR